MAYKFAECFWKNTCKDNAIKEDLTLYGLIFIVSGTSDQFPISSLFLSSSAVFSSETSEFICAPPTPVEYAKVVYRTYTLTGILFQP